MIADTLHNVNFAILLKQHGGNYPRAKAAWEKICTLGGYGNVPEDYAGGLDVKGIRIARDEFDQGEPQAMRVDPLTQKMIYFTPTSVDDIKRIEDMASGDRA